jgi:inorganic pyrophosphatase
MKKQQQHSGSRKPQKQNVIIETPRGSRNKYKFNHQTGRMKFSKVLPEGMMFPHDFGFILTPRRMMANLWMCSC